MPKFEVETSEDASRVLRAKDPEDAVRRAGLPESAEIAPEADVLGWRVVLDEGTEVGRVREHNRMRFRRD